MSVEIVPWFVGEVEFNEVLFLNFVHHGFGVDKQIPKNSIFFGSLLYPFF